jgi:hypothetical protein
MDRCLLDGLESFVAKTLQYNALGAKNFRQTKEGFPGWEQKPSRPIIHRFNQPI